MMTRRRCGSGGGGHRPHIEAYWTPKMRATFDEGMVEAKGLDPLVLDALSPDVMGKNPIEMAASGPGEAGRVGGGRRG